MIALLTLIQCYTLISWLSKTDPSTKSSAECHLLCKCYHSTTRSLTDSEQTFKTKCIPSLSAAVEYFIILNFELASYVNISSTVAKKDKKPFSLTTHTFLDTLEEIDLPCSHVHFLPLVMSTLFHNPHALWRIPFSIRSHAVKRLSFREASDPLSKYIPSLLCRHLLAPVLWNIDTICCPTFQLSLQQSVTARHLDLPPLQSCYFYGELQWTCTILTGKTFQTHKAAI